MPANKKIDNQIITLEKSVYSIAVILEQKPKTAVDVIEENKTQVAGCF